MLLFNTQNNNLLISLYYKILNAAADTVHLGTLNLFMVHLGILHLNMVNLGMLHYLNMVHLGIIYVYVIICRFVIIVSDLSLYIL